MAPPLEPTSLSSSRPASGRTLSRRRLLAFLAAALLGAGLVLVLVVRGSHHRPSAASSSSTQPLSPGPPTGLIDGAYAVDQTVHGQLHPADTIHVSTVLIHDGLVTVSIVASGDTVLPAPDGSCLQDSDGTQNPVYTQRLSVQVTTHSGSRYQGQLVFPANGLSAPVEFLYACQGDYPPVIIAR